MNDPSDNSGSTNSADDADRDFLKQFEATIQSYGAAMESGDRQEATAAAFSALMLATEEAMQNPTPEILLSMEASKCEETGDWLGAERVYRELAARYQSSGNPALVSKPWMDLSRLLRLLGRLDEAWQCALEATKSARAGGISPLTAQALENESICARLRGDVAHAMEAASAALEVLEPTRVMANSRAVALLNRAECFLAISDKPGAEADLSNAWELIDPKDSPPILPGYIGSLAKWWHVQATLERDRNNLPGAAAALKQAIAYRRQRLEGPLSPYVFLALAQELELFGQVADRCGQFEKAKEATDEARRIREENHLPP